MNFFKTVLKSTNPVFYKDLSARAFGQALKYFLLLLLLSSIIIFAVFIPKMLALPQNIEKELGKFNKFDVAVSIETREPLNFPENNPEIIINTNADYNLAKGRILITGDRVVAKKGLCFVLDPLCIFYKGNEATEYKFSDYNDITKAKEGFSKFFTALLILSAPSILVLLYLLLFLKYLAAIVIVALIAFVASKMMRVNTDFSQVFKSAIYASTIPLVLEIINVSFNLKLYYILLLVYLIFVIVVVYFIGEKSSDGDV